MVAIVVPRHTDANVAVHGCPVGGKCPVSCSDPVATEGHWVDPADLPSARALLETHMQLDRLIARYQRREISAVGCLGMGRRGAWKLAVWTVAADGGRL